MLFKPHNKRGQGIVHVSDLFKKYTQTLRAPQGIVVTAFIVAVEEVCGATLTKNNCTYNPDTHTLSVHASGMIKTEITLHKKEILRVMRDTISEKSLPKNIL
ncbi:hypothetical protein IPH92_04170 [Candidatus Kaiserbacteria bacterium]|nr:MAG: hypothetical protein IPH92_04170 [Candidatus Kaiserbacteria bacterium]